MLRLDFDPAGLIGALDDIAEEADIAARPAAQAAAQAFYEQVQASAPVAPGPHRDSGKVYPPGGLKASIYQAFSSDNSERGGRGYKVATYHVSWNHAKAPHGWWQDNGHWQRYVAVKDKNGDWHTVVRPELREEYARYIKMGRRARREAGLPSGKAAIARYFIPLPGGPRWIPPRPDRQRGFVRPAFDAAVQRANAAAVAEFARRMQRVL